MAKESLTISEFSRRTGVSASALRFYDSKSLLVPDRLPNGYRLYDETQIETARLVHSLREAGISIRDIHRFLLSSADLQNEWLATWRQEAEARLLHLQISIQFLSGVSPNSDRIHLIHWNRPTHMLWERRELSEPPSSFQPLLDDYRDKMANMGVKVGPEGYVRVLSVATDMVVELGFKIHNRHDNSSGFVGNLGTNQRIETISPTLFVGVRCASDDPYVCLQITRFVAQFGYVPVGSRLDMFQPNDDNVEVMIPVKQGRDIHVRPY